MNKSTRFRPICRFLGFFALFFICASVSAQSVQNHPDKNTLEQLNAELSKATNPNDSIRLLYNIFDVMSDDIEKKHESNRIATLEQLLATARNANNTAVTLDVVRNLSNLYKADKKKQSFLLDITRRLPESEEQRETLAFIRLTRNAWGASALVDRPVEERTENMRLALQDHQHSLDGGEDDIYTQFEDLLNLVFYGASMLQPEQINGYLHNLDSLVLLTRSSDASLANLYYTQAAQLYSQIGEHEKAVDSDRLLLDIIGQLEEKSRSMGRKYKNYDSFKFIVYRRMLSNYPALSDAEIDDLYKKTISFANARKNGQLPQYQIDYTDAMYAMAKKQYPKAIELFGRMFKSFPNFKQRPAMVLQYLKAAEAVGNQSALIEAQKLYIDILKGQAKVALDNEYGRLAINFNLDAIKLKNRQLEDRNKILRAEASHQAAIETHRWTVFLMSTIGGALAIILIIVVISFRRQRKLNLELKKVNERLRKERDAMHQTQTELTAARDRARAADRQKTEFIHSISHEVSEPVKAIVGYTQLIVDSIEGPRREYLNRFIDIIEANTLILQRLVNDVLDAAELENSRTTISIQNVSIESTLSLLADIYTPRLPENLRLVIEPVNIISNNPNDSGTIDTDPQRLEQILNNILNNAVKFTEKGAITVQSTIDRPNNLLTISVSDTGPGIPAGKEEKCFERFEKLGRYTQGTGLGLHVSRLLARMLGGDIVVDKDYRAGARFILTIPTRLSKKK